MNSLEQAKQYVEEGLNEGVRCPCCNQYAKQYKRKITSSMAWGLILIYKFYKRQGNLRRWLHIENYFKNIPNLPSSVRGDVSKLSHWGLIKRREGEREDGSKRVGFYKITEKGINFVEEKIRVSKHVFLYNGKPNGFSEEQADIKECLGEKFKYDGLMADKPAEDEVILGMEIVQGMQFTYSGKGYFLCESDSGSVYKCNFLRKECSCPSRKNPCKHLLEIEKRLAANGEGINNLDQWKKEQGVPRDEVQTHL